MGFGSHVLLLIPFSIVDLARRVDEAYTSGQELHLEGAWPLQAMLWTSTNLEARGRLFDVPLPVAVKLSLAKSVPVGSGSTLPQVVTHNAAYRSGGGYRRNVESFG